MLCNEMIQQNNSFNHTISITWNWSLERNKQTHTHKQKPTLYIKQFKMYFNAYNKNNTLNKNQ